MDLTSWISGAWADGSWVATAWGTPEPEPEPEVVVQKVVAAGGDWSWESHVKALHERHQLQVQEKTFKEEIRKVEKKIKKVEKQIAKSEHPKGILANLLQLEEQKNELQAKVQEVHDQLISLEWLIESIEIEEDDEEMMMLS